MYIIQRLWPQILIYEIEMGKLNLTIPYFFSLYFRYFDLVAGYTWTMFNWLNLLMPRLAVLLIASLATATVQYYNYYLCRLLQGGEWGWSTGITKQLEPLTINKNNNNNNVLMLFFLFWIFSSLWCQNLEDLNHESNSQCRTRGCNI